MIIPVSDICPSLVVKFMHDFLVQTHGKNYNKPVIRKGVKNTSRSGISFAHLNTQGNITGVFLGQVITNPITQRSIAQEVVWYSTGSSGFRLLKHAIEQARIMKIDEFYHTMVEPVDERAHRLLTHLGFEPVERSYLMKL